MCIEPTMSVRRRMSSLALLACLVAMSPLAAAPLLLSGQVEDGRAQRVLAPRTDAWQIQVQWMAEEGSQVDTGDVLVRFDPASIETRIEENDASQREVGQRHAKAIDDIHLRILETEINLARAENRVQIARLDAAIPADFLPAINHDRNQLELEKALAALEAVREQLAADKLALDMARAEAELDERRLASEREFLERTLSGLIAHAERPGYVIYGANRMRRGGGATDRVYPGDTVQAGDNVIEVSGRDALQVRVWIHEVDLLDLAVGQTAQIVFDARPQQTYRGHIEWMASQASARPLWGNANWFEAVVAFDEAPEHASPGMTVRVEPEPMSADLRVAEQAR